MSYEVSYEKLQKSLSIFADQMKQLEASREKLIKETREVISICSKSIILLHSNKTDEARSLLNTASSLIKTLKEYVISDLDRYLWPAEQEFVEAIILKEVKERQPFFSSHDDLNVSLHAYVTGLLDCIGEIKRMIYDSLRKNDLDLSLSLFKIMESIYDMIYPFSFYDNIISGIRKKLDISKRIIDDVRITITEEYRRKEFLSHLDHDHT